MPVWSAIVVLIVASQAAGRRVENWHRGAEGITAKEIRRCGFVVEMHEVTSADGYVTTAFRMRGGGKARAEAAGAGAGAGAGPAMSQPVVVHHGLLASSDKWFPLGSDSLPCLAAATGYDVWLPNARGSQYSRKHTKANLRPDYYWAFSFHEMGVNDLSATIDYILNVTKKQRVSYVGDSMGANLAFVLLSEAPEYNKKMNVAVSISPACFLNNTSNQMLRFMSYLPNYMERQWVGWTSGELPQWRPEMPRDDTQANTSYVDDTMQVLATVLDMRQAGSDGPSVDSTSLRTAAHMGQLIRNGGKFARYDFKKLNNIEKYGQEKPPNYDLGKITTRQFIIYGAEDGIVRMEDIRLLCAALPAAEHECHKVSWTGFRHRDLLSSVHARRNVYDIILRELDRAKAATSS